MIYYLYPDWKTQAPEAPMTSNVFPDPRVTDGQLVEAVLQALRATPVHRMSPAWAVQEIRFETIAFAPDARDWAMRFLQMKPSDYSIRWDISMDIWGSGGTIEFSGKDIAHMCAYWIAKGFPFETHNIEQLPDFREYQSESDDTEDWETETDISEWGTRHFPLPVRHKVVRYLWLQERNGHVFRRYLDIRSPDHYARYEYVVHEEGNPEPISSSERPVDRYLLELQLYAGLLPITASSPYRFDDTW